MAAQIHQLVLHFPFFGLVVNRHLTELFHFVSHLVHCLHIAFICYFLGDAHLVEILEVFVGLKMHENDIFVSSLGGRVKLETQPVNHICITLGVLV